MRDGVHLATDLYLPPCLPAPAIAVRTPYGRGSEVYLGACLALARRGYAVIAQDCRGTGDSEPDHWDYYLHEPEDGFDLVEWISRQEWFDGFLGSFGASYVGQTQWHMAVHPRMSTIVPEVTGLGSASQANIHMFANAYARSVGKGEDKLSVPYFELEAAMLQETLATGFFNEPLQLPLPETLMSRFPELRSRPLAEARRWLWAHYCALSAAERADLVKLALGSKSITIVDVQSFPALFGRDCVAKPHPHPLELCRSLKAPALVITGWYDWGLSDTLATWELLMREAPAAVRDRTRLFIAPRAHNMLGYHEGIAEHPELHHPYGVATNLEMLLHWYETVREEKFGSWPRVIYYLMGANEWRTACAWPPVGVAQRPLYLGHANSLTTDPPSGSSEPDRYIYDPLDPTPTVGGSIVSYVYPPGSVNVSAVQQRRDVVTYTTEPLEHDLDVAGPIRLILFASSSAVDTDFVGRLSDVFPDGRAIQLQNGILRARYRNLRAESELLEPGRIYRFEIDMWATANRFKTGHRLRLDISSADFPRFDRNANRGGEPGSPVAATQTIYHDSQHPSHLLVTIL